MAKLTVAGVDYAIKPLTLGPLEIAAPLMDDVLVFLREESQPGFASNMIRTLAQTRRFMTIFALGIDPADLGLTQEAVDKARILGAADPRAEALMALGNMLDIDGLWLVYAEVQREAGMIAKSGEAQPAPAGETQGQP